MNTQTTEYLHISLLLGQYIILPFVLWGVNVAKRTIIRDINAYVDKRVNGKLDHLVARVDEIEKFVNLLKLLKRAELESVMNCSSIASSQ